MFSLKLIAFILLNIMVLMIRQQFLIIVDFTDSITFHGDPSFQTFNKDPPMNRFPTTTINVYPGGLARAQGRMLPITVHEVHPYNRQFLPSFADVGFEFFSLSQSQFIRDRQFTKHDYYQMMQRVQTRFAPYGDIGKILKENNHEQVLQAIIRDFNFRNGMDYVVESTQIIRCDKIYPETDIHLDGERVPPRMRLWIPITSTFIDNLFLGVGDVRHMSHRECALDKTIPDERCSVGEDARAVRWYQRMFMTMQDWIFFKGEKVPHFSANLGSRRRTQERLAFVVNFIRRSALSEAQLNFLQSSN